MQHKCEGNQSIALLGSLPELGNWKQATCKLKWQPGDFWVTEKPIETTKYYFTYKYVLWDKNSDKLISWERGIDRIADLEVIPHVVNSKLGFAFNQVPGKDLKHLELDDIFEAFTCVFSVNFPESEDLSDVMTLNGKAGVINSVTMYKDTEKTHWMPIKYGKPMAPWKITVVMPNIESGENGQWKPATSTNLITYQYDMKNDQKNLALYEREPKREFRILDPSKYRGELGARESNLWANTEEVFVVNGFVNKGDGNFEGDFHCKSIGESGIAVGSYPENDMNVSEVKQLGCQAVIDIQSNNYRSISFEHSQSMFKRQGFNIIKNLPTPDLHEEDYIQYIVTAATELNDLINNRGQKVFIHCYTGISRAPTVIIAYLALFLRHPAWNDLEELRTYLRRYYGMGEPNMRAVKLCIERNQAIQNRERKRYEADLERQRLLDEEQRRKDRMKSDADEAERLRLKRLAEAEAEKIRQQRIQHQEDEKRRLKRIEDEEKEKERLRQDRENMFKQKLKAMLDEEARRQQLKRIQDDQNLNEEQKERARREAEIAAARKKLADLKNQLQLETERKLKERDEFDEEEKQRRFTMEKEAMERKKKDLEEQEAFERTRLKRRAEEDEASQIRLVKLTQLRSQQTELETEVEQLTELIHVKKLDEERQIELEKRRLVEMEARRKME